mgnify:CR=1 FL=1
MREQLMKLNEEPCREAIADWKNEGRDKSMNNSLHEIRNLSTHQGIFMTTEYTDWEDDIANDTEHPFQVRTVSITGKKNEQVSMEEFKKFVVDCLENMNKEVLWIKENADIRDQKKSTDIFY